MKPQNQLSTLLAIRAMGLEARVQNDKFRVNFWRGKEATAYYTDDAQDAVATARVMLRSKV